MLSDYGWALTELGRFDEAELILEASVRFAGPDDDLPANNLKWLRQLRDGSPRARRKTKLANAATKTEIQYELRPGEFIR